MARLAAADRVEIVFHLGGELVVDQVRQDATSSSCATANATQVGTSALPFLKTYSRARIVSMIEAYVLGRPMPISSSARVSEASLNRAGGCVVWLLGSSSRHVQRLADRRRSGSTRVLVGQFGLRIVAAFDVRPQVAGEVDRLAADLEHARRPPSIVIVMRRPRASAIWLATVRFQIRS